MQSKRSAGSRSGGKATGKRGVRDRKQKPRKRSRGRGFVWAFFLLLFAIVCAVVGYLLVILNGERILSENVNKLTLDEATIIVDRNDNQVAKLNVYDGNREFVTIDQIPKLLQEAFVATEDKRFYEHSGVDLIGIGRALVKDIMHLSAKEGASTITQQLARNLFLSAEKTLFRKGTEASIALALERHKSKDEILELYLNRIYFGKGQYGIKTAAKYYFNKDITSKDKDQQLEIWEIATLAALPKAPSTYNPVANPEKSKERRAVVLTIMRDQGLITAEEAEAAKKVDYDPSVVPQSSQRYQSFIDYVVDEAKAVTNLSEEELLTGGYTIKTTLDTQAQAAMETVFSDDSKFDKSVDDQLMQAAMVIMDQHDGALLAMLGGRDYQKQGWNRAVKQRQPGSAFKPISVYGPAIESGEYFPWSILRDDKVCYDNGKYCPTDSNKVKYIGPVSMAQAIKESRNQPAVWLLNEMGVKRGLDFAGKLGFMLDPQQDRNLAIALGGLTNGVSPLEMARAYGAFANGGKLQDPHSILSIVNKKGRTIYTFNETQGEQVMKPETAYYVTQMLRGVTESGGTGTKARISGRAVAGKTGTTQHGLEGVNASGNRDIWFVGYTPELTAAVWMGYDKTDKDHLVQQNSTHAAEIFSAVMSKALEGKKKLSFPQPKQVEKAKPELEVSGLSAAYSPDNVSVELNWLSHNTSEHTTYRVYRKSGTDSEFALLAETVELMFEDMAILPDMTYSYYVTAYDPAAKQESKPTEQVSVTTDSGFETAPPDDELEPGDDEYEWNEDEGFDSESPSGSPPSSEEPGGDESGDGEPGDDALGDDTTGTEKPSSPPSSSSDAPPPDDASATGSSPESNLLASEPPPSQGG